MRIWKPFPGGLTYLLPEPKKEPTRVEYNDVLFLFSREEDPGPTLPLLMAGTYARPGGCLHYWALDASRQAWLDRSCCGSDMNRCTVKEVLADMEHEQPGSSYELRIKLGMKPPLAEWAKSALNAGWTPPAGFVRSDYE